MDCGSENLCLPVQAIVGQDPSAQETVPSIGPPSDWARPGSHRYIGIGMVAGLVFVILVLYLTCARRPRRFFNQHFRRRPCNEPMRSAKGDAFIAPSPLITRPEKAQPKSGGSGHNVGFVGRMVAEHTTADQYLVQSQWAVQQPHSHPHRRSSDDNSQSPIYPVRRPPS